MLAARLKEIRLIKGLSQKHLGRRINVTQQGFHNFENSRNPRMDTLIRLCEIMEINVNFLFAFDIPVTEENLIKYGAREFGDVIHQFRDLAQEHKDLMAEHKQLKQKLEFLTKLNKSNTPHIQADRTLYLPMAAGQ